MMMELTVCTFSQFPDYGAACPEASSASPRKLLATVECAKE